MVEREKYYHFEKNLSRIDHWFKGQWKNGSAKQKEELHIYKMQIKRFLAKGFGTVKYELKQDISVKTLKTL